MVATAARLNAMKGFWKTYLALAVLAGLGYYIYAVDAKKPTSDDSKKEKVFAVDKAKVQEITIVNGAEPKIDVQKDGSSWRLSAPVAAQADANAIESVLSSVDAAEISDSVTDQPSGLSQYGLEHPRISVGVKADAGMKEVLLGNKTPDEMAVYAKYADKPRIFTVASHIATSFAKKPADIRDRNILHLKRDAVRSIDIKGADKDVVLTKDEKGDWNFTKPFPTKGARWAVDGLLLSMESLAFDDVAAENASDLKPYGLDKPKWTAVLELADGSTKKLEIGDSATKSEAPKTPLPEGATDTRKFYARDAAQPLVGVISAAVVTDIEKADDKLRSRYLLDFPALEVKTIDVTSDGKTRKYERSVTKDGSGTDVRKWKQVAPETKDIETKTIEDLLFEVASTDVTAFIDAPKALATYGLEPPAVRVDLTFDNKKPAWFEVGVKDGVAYGRRDNDVAITKLAAKGKDVVIDGFRNKL
jgi:hypothetical protein